MSDCLLTKLPVAVPGNREKLGKLFYRRYNEETDGGTTNITMNYSYLAPFYISWDDATTEYNVASENPRRLPQSGDSAGYIQAVCKRLDTATPDETGVWVEKYNIRGLEIRPNVYIPENSGLEWMLSSPDSNLDYLDLISNHSIDGRILDYSRLKVLRIDASNLQSYQIQELLNNCPNLVYISLHNDDATSTVSFYKTNGVTFPDNLKYIRNCPSKVLQLSANCEEVSLDSNMTGNLEDFVAKAIAAGRIGSLQEPEQLIFFKQGISSSLKLNGESVSSILTTKGITGSYFKLVWSKVDDTVSIDIEAASTQTSIGIDYTNYTRLL